MRISTTLEIYAETEEEKDTEAAEAAAKIGHPAWNVGLKVRSFLQYIYAIQKQGV